MCKFYLCVISLEFNIMLIEKFFAHDGLRIYTANDSIDTFQVKS